jgi:hypothetical protein
MYSPDRQQRYIEDVISVQLREFGLALDAN